MRAVTDTLAVTDMRAVTDTLALTDLRAVTDIRAIADTRAVTDKQADTAIRVATDARTITDIQVITDTHAPALMRGRRRRRRRRSCSRAPATVNTRKSYRSACGLFVSKAKIDVLASVLVIFRAGGGGAARVRGRRLPLRGHAGGGRRRPRPVRNMMYLSYTHTYILL